MILIPLFLIIVILSFLTYQIYLKEFFELTKVYKALKKMLETRDMLVLKIIPDIKKKKVSGEVAKLIDERIKQSKISYNDVIKADVELHNKLKELYEIINDMKKTELQIEIFKRIINIEKQLRTLRNKYTQAVEKYNMQLTVHPKVCIKIFHLTPLDTYSK